MIQCLKKLSNIHMSTLGSFQCPGLVSLGCSYLTSNTRGAATQYNTHEVMSHHHHHHHKPHHTTLTTLTPQQVKYITFKASRSANNTAGLIFLTFQPCAARRVCFFDPLNTNRTLAMRVNPVWVLRSVEMA